MEASLQFDGENKPVLSTVTPFRESSATDALRMPKDAPRKGIQIQPTAGFSYKTKRTKDNGKVFINIVQHEKLQKPGTKKKLDAKGNEVEGLNIPMSVGMAHEETDKKGVVCTAYDIVVHPDVLRDMEDDGTGKFREFLCQLGIQCVEQKYSEQLDKRYKLPKLFYFGEKIPTQMIQDRENMPKIEEYVGKSTPKAKKEEPKVGVAAQARPLQDLPIRSYWGTITEDHHGEISSKNILWNEAFNKSIKSVFSSPEVELLSPESPSTTAEFPAFSLAKSSSVSMGDYVEPMQQAAPESAYKAQMLVLVADFQAYDATLLKATPSSSSSSNSGMRPLSLDIAAYTIKIAVPGYKPVTLYLGVTVRPSRCYHHVVKITGAISLHRLVVILSLDLRPYGAKVDPGSKAWLVVQALRSEDDGGSDDKSAQKDALLVDDDSDDEADRDNQHGDSTLSQQRYPGSGILDLGQVDDDTELPEDRFHRKDAASSYILSQREQSRLDKAKKYDEERKVLAQDPNVEFVDMHKPQNSGVQYDRGDGGNSNSGSDPSEVYRTAAEITAQKVRAQFTSGSSSTSAAAAEGAAPSAAMKALTALQSNMWTELLD